MFPLLTQSRVNPRAPVPTRADFAFLLAADEGRCQGMRRAFIRMACASTASTAGDGKVERASGWMEGFADMGTDTLPPRLVHPHACSGRSRVCLKTRRPRSAARLETELQQHRAGDTREPLAFWRLACSRLISRIN